MITVHPGKLAASLAPKKTIERLVTTRLTLNRAVLASLSAKQDIVAKKTLERVALKVLRNYKSRYADARARGTAAAKARAEATNQNRQMVQRVQNTVATEIAEEVADKFDGERYTWLPSSAKEPDPVHQLNYGKTFVLGVGEKPGDRPGCQCGMRIHVKGERLEL